MNAVRKPKLRAASRSDWWVATISTLTGLDLHEFGEAAIDFAGRFCGGATDRNHR